MRTDPPGHRRPGARLARHRPPDGQPRRPPRHPARRRRCRRSTPTPSRPRCTASTGLAEHFLYLNDDFLLGRPVRPEAFFSPAGPDVGVLLPETVGLTDDPDAPPFLQGRVEQPQPAAGGLRRGDHAQPRARAVRPPGLGAARRCTSGSPRRSPPPRGRRSAATPTCRRSARWPSTTACSPARRTSARAPDLALRQHHQRRRRAAAAPVLRRDQDFICLGDHHDHALRAERLDRAARSVLTASTSRSRRRGSALMAGSFRVGCAVGAAPRPSTRGSSTARHLWLAVAGDAPAGHLRDDGGELERAHRAGRRRAGLGVGCRSAALAEVPGERRRAAPVLAGEGRRPAPITWTRRVRCPAGAPGDRRPATGGGARRVVASAAASSALRRGRGRGRRRRRSRDRAVVATDDVTLELADGRSLRLELTPGTT